MDERLRVQERVEARYTRMAIEIAALIEDEEHEGRRIDEDLLSQVVHGLGPIGDFNQYPSSRKGRCCKAAFFFALKESRKVNPRIVEGSVGTFKQMIEALVRHMQGTCAGYTEEAVLITDSWSCEVYQTWKANIREIASKAHLEILLIVGRNVTVVNF